MRRRSGGSPRQRRTSQGGPPPVRRSRRDRRPVLPPGSRIHRYLRAEHQLAGGDGIVPVLSARRGIERRHLRAGAAGDEGVFQPRDIVGKSSIRQIGIGGTHVAQFHRTDQGIESAYDRSLEIVRGIGIAGAHIGCAHPSGIARQGDRGDGIGCGSIGVLSSAGRVYIGEGDRRRGAQGPKRRRGRHVRQSRSPLRGDIAVHERVIGVVRRRYRRHCRITNVGRIGIGVGSGVDRHAGGIDIVLSYPIGVVRFRRVGIQGEVRGGRRGGISGGRHPRPGVRDGGGQRGERSGIEAVSGRHGSDTVDGRERMEESEKESNGEEDLFARVVGGTEVEE
mmetsp:Transcript_55413/g.166144  ORF Transcript_55413/g.166144 Transcript_55413/m.166144 type:complete len:336 (-) Transcript_55413:27-1034(-)